MRYTPDGSLLAAVYQKGGQPDTVVVYSTESDEAVNELECSKETKNEHVTSMEFSPDGISIALSFDTGAVKLWTLGSR